MDNKTNTNKGIEQLLNPFNFTLCVVYKMRVIKTHKSRIHTT